MYYDGVKYLTASRLIELLNTVPEDTLIMPNQVGNLSLLDKEGHIGFIDFVADGEVELYTQEST